MICAANLDLWFAALLAWIKPLEAIRSTTFAFQRMLLQLLIFRLLLLEHILFDISTHHRALACVVLATFFRLNRAFFADLILAKVKLLKFLLIDRQNKGRQYADFYTFVNGKFVLISVRHNRK